MKPDYQRDGVTLYCADCLDVLPHLKGVDAVVTDPPYGIGFKYESHNDTPDGYGGWLWSVISQCEEKASPSAPIFVWQAMPNAPRFSQWFPRDYRIFAACKNFVQMRPTPMQYSYDPVVVWWKDGGKPWSAGTSTRDYHVADTTPQGRKKFGDIVEGHPCPRPLHQVRHMIEQWVRPDSIVLDPFLGSGTTGVACVRLGRKFIGIEKERKYFDVAVERIEAELNQGDLFREAI